MMAGQLIFMWKNENISALQKVKLILGPGQTGSAVLLDLLRGVLYLEVYKFDNSNYNDKRQQYWRHTGGEIST